MASGRAAAVAEVVRWLEERIRQGRLKVGSSFPSERELSRQLKVGRGAIREAKAMLNGRGVLAGELVRTPFVQLDAAMLVREWIVRVTAPGDWGQHRAVREALELRRLVLPEMTSLAVRRASDKKRADLVAAYSSWRLMITVRGSHRQVMTSQEELLLCCADLAGNAPLLAMTAALVQAGRNLPLFQNIYDERATWSAALEQTIERINARRASSARSVLRRHLGQLDKKLLKMLEGRRGVVAAT